MIWRNKSWRQKLEYNGTVRRPFKSRASRMDSWHEVETREHPTLGRLRRLLHTRNSIPDPSAADFEASGESAGSLINTTLAFIADDCTCFWSFSCFVLRVDVADLETNARPKPLRLTSRGFIHKQLSCLDPKSYIHPFVLELTRT